MKEMKEKKSCSATVLRNLIEYLIMCLEELTDTQEPSQYSEGVISAFVECLEITSKWTNYRKFGIEDIEKRFPIK